MLFIDQNTRIDKEALRQYVESELKRLGSITEALVSDERYGEFWEELHRMIVSVQDEEQREEFMGLESELKTLPMFFRGWLNTAVESEERFEFFIQTKATEVRSGDEVKDYFWALQIRHDQLVALVEEGVAVVQMMKTCVGMKVEEVLEAREFVARSKIKIEERIYIKAQQIQAQREQMSR